MEKSSLARGIVSGRVNCRLYFILLLDSERKMRSSNHLLIGVFPERKAAPVDD